MAENPALRATDMVELNPTFLFRWEEPQQAYVLLYPEGLVKLNASAGEIMAMIAETTMVGDLIEHFSATYNDQDIASDILAFLEASHERGWIRKQQ